MPTYLCHGFRWHREGIRAFVVIRNVDDAAPEWIVAPGSSTAILEAFYTLFDFLPELPPSPPAAPQPTPGQRPDFAMPAPVRASDDDVLRNEWSAVKLLEEYDPADEKHLNRPYAFVADFAKRIDLSTSVVEEIARYEEAASRLPASERAMSVGSSDEFARRAKRMREGTADPPKGTGWLERLRDLVQKDEDIRWYVVVCGDEERAVPNFVRRPSPPREHGVLDDRGRVLGVETPARAPRGQPGPRNGPTPQELALLPGYITSGTAAMADQRMAQLLAQAEEHVEEQRQDHPGQGPTKGGGLRRLFGKKGEA